LSGKKKTLRDGPVESTSLRISKKKPNTAISGVGRAICLGKKSISKKCGDDADMDCLAKRPRRGRSPWRSLQEEMIDQKGLTEMTREAKLYEESLKNPA